MTINVIGVPIIAASKYAIVWFKPIAVSAYMKTYWNRKFGIYESGKRRNFCSVGFVQKVNLQFKKNESIMLKA